MKKFIFAAMLAFVTSAFPVAAQHEAVATAETSIDTTLACASPCQIFKIGYLSYNALLQSLPAYHEAMRQFEILAANYETEAVYNETNFKRKFSEYLQGQKDFPHNILLKRQKDLQEEMEKAMAFRMAADSLLQQAKLEMLAPVKADLDTAIRVIGEERGYMEIVNTDIQSHLFINPKLAEDAAPYVLQRLNGVKE